MNSTWMVAGAIAGAVLLPPSGTAQTPLPAGQPTIQIASAERANPDAEFVARAAEGGRRKWSWAGSRARKPRTRR